MKLSIRRIPELTGSFVSLDIYVNGKVRGKVPPGSEVELNIDSERADIFVKTSWCESNRLTATSDSKLRTYADGGLLGATFNAIFRPKKTYVLELDAN